MAITEAIGHYGDKPVTTTHVIRTHDPDRQFGNLRSPKMDIPVQKYHPQNINQKTLKLSLPQMDDKARKEKKWSIGKLFRRKKKDGNGSSSESDGCKKLDNRKKRHKKNHSHTSFDHIVANQTEHRRAHSVTKHPTNEYIDEGILSDPSAGFVGFIGRGLPRLPREAHLTSRDSLDKRGAGSSCGSQEGSLRKGRKGRMKARVEAIRNSLRHESSSDDDSQKSSTSSSIVRFRSDDSLTNSRDGSLNKKSRSARTERYIKRLSRDDENFLNKEAELLKKGHSKSEVELIMRSRSTQNEYVNVSSSVKPENNNYVNVENKHENLKLPKLSNSIPLLKSFSPGIINFNAKVNDENITYSIPYQNQSEVRYTRQSYNQPVSDNVSYNSLNSSYDNDNVMVIKFPLGNGSVKPRDDKAPPVPPRDPQRRLTTPVSAIYENSKYNSPSYNNIMRNHSHSDIPNKRPISSSEDHIAMQEKFSGRGSFFDRQQPRRPASVSAEPSQSYFQNHFIYRSNGENKRTTLPPKNQTDLIYYADQTPRSRKPIHIRSNSSIHDQRYLSDSQSSIPQSENSNLNYPQIRPRNATEFWRKIDSEENDRRRLSNFSRTKALSDQTNLSGLVSPNRFIVSPSYKPFHNNVIKPMAYRIDSSGGPIIYRQSNGFINPRDEVDNANKFVYPDRNVKNQPPKIISEKHLSNHIRHKSESQVSGFKRFSSDEDKINENRKSTNLDEALNELEAIYNSLGLGDEDLLDRAERREQMTSRPAPKSLQSNYNGIPNVTIRPYGDNRYRAKRLSIPDKVNDDMALRRFNQNDKSNTKDTKGITTNVSYMHASSMNDHFSDDEKPDVDRPEPDVLLDDVVYRNIKHAKNHLKVIEPQPPFGIPLGPISPSPQSDYLHANPETILRPRFTSRKSPDLVSDDLAFRTLRKDSKNHSSPDEMENITSIETINKTGVVSKDSLPNLKKKRAVRSLSANIFSMIQKEIDDALNMSRLATMERAQSITDLNKSLKEIVAQNKNVASPVACNGQPILLQDQKSKEEGLSNKILKKVQTTPPNVLPVLRKYTREEFDEAIDVLAKETKDTSDKLGIALAELENIDMTKFKGTCQSDLAKGTIKNDDDVKKISDKANTNQSRLQEKESIKDNIEVTSKQKYLINNEMAVEDNLNVSQNLSSAGKRTEASLLAISNQLQIVESKLKNNVDNKINFMDEKIKLDAMGRKIKNNVDKKLNFSDEGRMLESVQDKIQSNLHKVASLNEIPQNNRNRQTKMQDVKESKKVQPVHNQESLENKSLYLKNTQPDFIDVKEKIEEMTKAAENYIKSQAKSEPSNDTKINLPKSDYRDSSIVINNEEKNLEKMKKECGEPTMDVNAIKSDISSMIHEISEVNNKLNIVNVSTEIKGQPLDDGSQCAHVSDSVDTLEYNSSEELASIFNSESNSKNAQRVRDNNYSENGPNCSTRKRSDGDLDSPSLVKTIDNSLRRVSETESPESTSTCIPQHRQNSSSTCVPWRRNRAQNNPGSSNSDEFSSGKSSSWYRDPGNVVLACSYTLAISQQLVGLDALTILGIILAMISIIAMLLI